MQRETRAALRSKESLSTHGLGSRLETMTAGALHAPAAFLSYQYVHRSSIDQYGQGQRTPSPEPMVIR